MAKHLPSHSSSTSFSTQSNHTHIQTSNIFIIIIIIMFATRLLILALTLCLVMIAYPIRVQGAVIASRRDTHSSDEDPPSPPQDDDKTKQCLSKCNEYVNKYWPQCQDRQSMPFDLCSVADMLCANRCKGKGMGPNGGLGDWMEAAGDYIEQIYRSME
ncbi:unnamed protein product [Mortierella alpina]